MADWTLSETYDTGDGTVRWTSIGEGDPVVLLHGTPFSSFVWRDVAPVLAAKHKVYVWDMLGFGQSDMREHQDVSLAAQSRIFKELLELWGVRQPSVIAHDVGGVVALRTTLLDEVAFRDLTLIDAVSISGWGRGGFFQTIRENPDVFMQLPDWATDALIESKIRTASYPGLRPEALKVYLEAWRGPQGRRAFYRQYAQCGEQHSDEFQERLAMLSMPVRILWGREDSFLPVEYAQRLHALLPHADFTIINEAGHLVPEDAPGTLLSHLAA
jgi:pimeloyl-ACP methyl ester carboxylesterase